jgi:hypothetical protein
MALNGAFLMKDLVFLAASFYLLKQDLERASQPPIREGQNESVYDHVKQEVTREAL